MVMFQMPGKSTPATTYIMEKIEKLTSEDIIGTGGYGTVYRLVLDDETVLAVKKLSRGGIDRERGFERELETLADLKHKNLVSLRGYYSAPHINILLYDLMGNGGLDTWLHGVSSIPHLFIVCSVPVLCWFYIRMFLQFRGDKEGALIHICRI